MHDTILMEGESLDDTGFADLSLIQHHAEFRYGIDAVLLADFARVKSGARVIDLGTASGIIPLVLSHKTKAREIWGVELQAKVLDRGLRTIEHNHLSHRIHLVQGDVKDLKDQFAAESFDVVVTNPPYTQKDGGLVSSNDAKGLSRHESSASLTEFLAAAYRLLRDRGDFYMIHRPSRLVDIFATCRDLSLEPKRLRFVAPARGKKPNLVLLHCVKRGGTELSILEPLYVYRRQGGYTNEILEIYERQK